LCYPIRGDDPHRDRLKAHALGEVLAFGTRAKRYVMGQIRRDALQARRDPNDYAAEVALGNIEDYVDFAADPVQVWPLASLPVTDAEFAITGRIASQASPTILVGTVIITVVLDAWISTRAPHEYASHEFLGLTIAAGRHRHQRGELRAAADLQLNPDPPQGVAGRSPGLVRPVSAG
jgi:hypothetical protein